MRRLIYIVVGLTIVLYVFSCNSEEYYIPKPKAKIKIELPSQVTFVFEDDIIRFSYSNSAVLEKDDNVYKIKYDSYNSDIVFSVKEIIDLDLDVYNFENKITVHEKQGADINVNIIEDSESEMYGVLCYLEGNKIATSSQFFITDSTNYFVSGGLEFNTSINSEIEVQNNIMKQAGISVLGQANQMPQQAMRLIG